ncbi:LacI family DNA-binding transcriptional regulator [bacterium]|nr:LacI family DNA-binding transcriptional regulator [bacterium]
MGITIKDVAQRAGVSMSTVSRVLNNICPVDSEKRTRVEEAVEELGYTPNPAARSLLSNQTGGVGIILPFVSGEFFSEFLNGVDEVAQSEGIFILISTSHHSASELKAALSGMYKRVDGLLIMAPNMVAEEVIRLTPNEVPFVFVNTQMNTEKIDGITFDNYGGMYAMVMHLVSKGHRRIAFLTGPKGAHDASERLRGYVTAMKDTGVTIHPELIIPGQYTQKSGYDSVSKILALAERPTAIMASNDDAAVGVMSALRDAGVSAPSEMAVTGFDDVPSAQYSTPPLTSVHVPIRQFGMAAMRLLISRLRGEPHVLQNRVLPVELRIRESSI